MEGNLIFESGSAGDLPYSVKNSKASMNYSNTSLAVSIARGQGGEGAFAPNPNGHKVGV